MHSMTTSFWENAMVMDIPYHVTCRGAAGSNFFYAWQIQWRKTILNNAHHVWGVLGDTVGARAAHGILQEMHTSVKHS